MDKQRHQCGDGALEQVGARVPDREQRDAAAVDVPAGEQAREQTSHGRTPPIAMSTTAAVARSGDQP